MAYRRHLDDRHLHFLNFLDGLRQLVPTKDELPIREEFVLFPPESLLAEPTTRPSALITRRQPPWSMLRLFYRERLSHVEHYLDEVPRLEAGTGLGCGYVT